jgi:hypothetical protein
MKGEAQRGRCAEPAEHLAKYMLGPSDHNLAVESVRSPCISGPNMRVLFLFVGEPHHVFHSLPIAAELRRLAPAIEIEVATTSDSHDEQIARVRQAYPDLDVSLVRLKKPFRWLSFRGGGIGRGEKRSQTLIAALPYLRRFDAIVVPERTTTMIKPFLSRRTKLIFTPHGAGDRAITQDPRDIRFDFLLVAGKKSERRLLEAGTARPGDYAVTGYVKFDLLSRLGSQRLSSFGNGRPTVLYAPHFRLPLSSWGIAEQVIEAFRAQDRFNLIVAPHMRLFHNAGDAAKAKWEALAEPGKIIVDLGSPKLTDMSYTTEADIYLGDVSSQVYEYLSTPRPCVFIDTHDTDWKGNPDYLFWTLGEVVSRPRDIMPAIERAADLHPAFAPLQRAAVVESCGADIEGAAERSAEAIVKFLNRGKTTSLSDRENHRQGRSSSHVVPPLRKRS